MTWGASASTTIPDPAWNKWQSGVRDFVRRTRSKRSTDWVRGTAGLSGCEDQVPQRFLVGKYEACMYALIDDPLLSYPTARDPVG